MIRCHLPEARRQMHRDVPVALLETAVLSDVMQVVTSDDNGTLHLQLAHNSGEDATANANVAGERTLLIDVGAIDGLEDWGEQKRDNLVGWWLLILKRFQKVSKMAFT